MTETEKCGGGYPSIGLSCIRPKGHQSPVSDCFAVSDGHGVYMQQDGRDWVGPDRTRWPDDVLIEPEPEPEPEPMPHSDRRAAIAATKAKHATK